MTCKSVNANQIPAYIIERLPLGFFGEASDQGGWTQTVIRVIEGFSSKYVRAVSDGQDLQDLFYDTFKEATVQRGQIASLNKTKDSSMFGSPRCFIHEKFGSSSFGTQLITHLAGQYTAYDMEYRLGLAKWIDSHFTAFQRSKNLALQGAPFSSFLVDSEDFKPISGRTSRVEMYMIPLVEGGLVDKEFFGKSFLDVQQIVAPSCRSAQQPLPENPAALFKLIDGNAPLLKIFKEKMPDAYRHWIYQKRVKSFFEEKLVAESDLPMMYLVVRINRLQMRGQKQATALSSLLSVANIARKSLWLSCTQLLHQDQFLVQKTMAEAASVFKEIVEHKGSAEELKASLALLEYLLANATPVARGNAAVTEWIILSLALYKGYRLFYPAKKCMNLEALVKPFPEFMKEYTTGVVLEKIEEEPQSAAAAAAP